MSARCCSPAGRRPRAGGRGLRLRGGERAPGGGATLRVTRDFGHTELGSARLDKRPRGRDGDAHAALEVRRDHPLRRPLRAVDRRPRGRRAPAGRRDWFFFVNGVEADKGAAEWRRCRPGDRIQWDYRDWGAAMRVPAIVGAFPEPFANGLEGKRRPVRVECDDAESRSRARDAQGRARARRTCRPRARRSARPAPSR